MAIVKQYHADSRTTYVYESFSYWDPEKKQSRAKRRLIGKLDPVTGEVVPTGKPGRPKSENPAKESVPSRRQVKEPAQQDTEVERLTSEAARLNELLAELKRKNLSLNERVIALESEVRRLQAVVGKASSLAEKLQSVFADTTER